MTKNGEYVHLPADLELCDEGSFDARRFGEEILRSCETAKELGVPVVIDTPDSWVVIGSDLQATIRPKAPEKQSKPGPQ